MFNKALLACTTAVLFAFVCSTSTCSVSDGDKVDCGFVGVDQGQCEAKGCCWSPAGQNSATPWCFSPSLQTGYSLSEMVSTSTGYSGKLTLLGQPTQTYGPDIQHLQLDVIFTSTSTIEIKIKDATKTRWEVPQSVVSRPSPTSNLSPSQLQYDFSYTSSPFTFKVVRKADGATVFNMDKPFVYKDQYLELSTSIQSSDKTFGIGESTRLEQALKPGSTYTLWAADIPAAAFYKNLYGSFPYYMQLSPTGAAHGALLLSSNGMDVTLTTQSITFKTIGGILDLYVFAGSSPDDVTMQYTSIVGRPTMMPYWSLGFHNCKYGYESLSQVESIVQNYKTAAIPLETQWMDIDYMQDYRDFTWGSANFPADKVKQFVDTLHSNGQHFVPIVDPGIMVYPGYDAYETGIKEVSGNESRFEACITRKKLTLRPSN
jgi:alpha-glucosidase (family GH31 glycosyl hydrolase)